jgi:hypothetical protein
MREGLGKVSLQDLPLVKSSRNETSVCNPKVKNRSTGITTKPPPPLLKSSKKETKSCSNKARNFNTGTTLKETQLSSFKTGRRAKIFF